ncbi:TetR/AcrR family transcriptional regulator [Paenibacillus montanisoli]|uniref:HTH tetR-type domain-containing protein n=1 Tax=Paenibacillus montanisoli TaxID=2081970 RepID=A0A328U3F5_9BACL|nr:helix-turn-helix domain-containing protein [Paenibacillus montanisoli]RAP77130.1 hypothetical protein DL346_01090 [Paenibacillus montanisoli]
MKKDTTRQRIIEKAEKQFIQQGIPHVQMKDIATALNLNRRTLYRYLKVFEPKVSSIGQYYSAGEETITDEHALRNQLEFELDQLLKRKKSGRALSQMISLRWMSFDSILKLIANVKLLLSRNWTNWVKIKRAA